MNKFNDNIAAMFSKLEDFVSSKTVVGEPIQIGDVTIVPFVDVSFGMAAGASVKSKERDNKDNSTGGIGGKITPNSIMIINKGNVQLLNIGDANSVNKIIDMIPGVINKFTSSTEEIIDDTIKE